MAPLLLLPCTCRDRASVGGQNRPVSVQHRHTFGQAIAPKEREHVETGRYPLRTERNRGFRRREPDHDAGRDHHYGKRQFAAG